MKHLASFYQWLWRHIGGRPWTYILRDYYHEAEYVVIVGMLALGYFAANYEWLDRGEFALFTLSLTAGYILGHLFWGTRWVPGEKAPPQAPQ